MTKKDYIAIAAIIKAARKNEPHRRCQPVINGIERDFIALLKSDNPRFDAQRFRAAATPEK